LDRAFASLFSRYMCEGRSAAHCPVSRNKDTVGIKVIHLQK
jgi:hypothetical protein